MEDIIRHSFILIFIAFIAISSKLCINFIVDHPLYSETRKEIYIDNCARLKVVKSIICDKRCKNIYKNKIKELICWMPDCYKKALLN